MDHENDGGDRGWVRGTHDARRVFPLKDFDLSLLEPVAKSIRLNGKSTCIRLERIYWRLLEMGASCLGVPVNSLLASLDWEVQRLYGSVTNFSALVRGVAVMLLARAAKVAL